jgi:Na+-transporting NADH:ubiquinone oxidoreductase subunit NqrB
VFNLLSYLVGHPVGSLVGNLVGRQGCKCSVRGSNAGWAEVVTSCLGGYCVGGIIGAPHGTMLTGKIMRQNGSWYSAFIGGILGTVLGISELAVYNNGISQNSWSIVISTALALPPLCSVVGYNLIPHKNNSQSNIFSKNLPAIGLSVLPEKHGDKISPKIGANIRFRF